ncbi:PEP-CTERM sorting domain-containing protein [Myxococcota bacterium]|nr:PEP-CTERM sorting domain-containing protein [Myxococcota bacterium]
MKLSLQTLLGLGLASAVALIAVPRDAQAVSVTVGYAGNPNSFRTLTDRDTGLGCGSAGAEGQLSCVGAGLDNGGWSLDRWNLLVDPDPTINNVFSVTNNTGGTQSFVVTVSLPSAISFGPPSFIRGSIQGGATDNNFNGVTLSNTGTSAIYDGLIDGSSVRTLFGNPTSATGVGSVSLGVASFGIPVQESVAVATTTSIALTLRFDLSAGDSASFTSVFDVQPIPEPGTALLVGLGLAGLAARRRRA